MILSAKVVAQYNDVFYFPSETFIHNYISRLKIYQPIYLAREYEHLDLFPVPAEDCYTASAALSGGFAWPWQDFPEVKVLKQRQAKLIHAHFGPQGYFALKLKRKCSIPLVTSFYGYDISELARVPLWVKRYQSLFQEGDLFLVEGNFMKARLAELGCPESKIAIQRVAIPLDKFPYTSKPAKSNDEKVIFIFAGRFCEKKGLIYALQAVAKLKTKYPNFEFRLIGDGPLKPQVEEFINTNGLAGQVKLLGFLNYENYIKEMQAGDIFLHPSITAKDGNSEGGAPTTILEAQACGMPIVSTYHADIPNVVVPGKSALLANERDVEALYVHLVSLMENRKAWADMGKIGRQFVEKYHNIDNEVIELENKYMRVINAG
jgi:colanic acid/amylovoran biosynthesis glycosyltransferase